MLVFQQNKLKKAFIILFFSLLSFLSFADDKKENKPYNLKDIVSSEIYTTLLKKGVINNTLSRNAESLKLVPNTEFSEIFINKKLEKVSLDDYFITESLHLVSKKYLQKTSKKENVDVSLNKISKILRSISKMKGMTYYSNSDKKWEVLYTEAYTIEGPNSSKKIADKTEESINGQVDYCYLKDHSFSGCRYELNYKSTENEIGMNFTNLDVLKKYFLKVAGPRNMNNFVVVIDCGDSYLFYSTIQAKGPKVALLENKLNASLESRIDAIYNWFIYQF